MNRISKFLIALVGLALVAFVAWRVLSSKIELTSPQPRAAWVGIEVGNSGVAQVGEVELERGQAFTLHAILEAETSLGEVVYFTEADQVEIAGRRLGAESIRTWTRKPVPRFLWFTVEGSVPYLEVGGEVGLERFKITDFLHPDWPQAWSFEGRIDLAHDDRIEAESEGEAARFGIQRFHLRIELYSPDNPLVPKERFSSPGSKDLQAVLHSAEGDVALPEGFATVVIRLPRASRASQAFGLTQLQPTADADEATRAALSRLTRQRLAFSTTPLLSEILHSAGLQSETLSGERADLDAQLPWGQAAAVGDLLRAGDRWVVLYKDLGVPGVLDRDDLCLDFGRGAAVRPLRVVFAGGGDVEVVRLTAASP